MNRRSFLATVLGAAASIPLLSKVAPQPNPEPKADTLGQEGIALQATGGPYCYGYIYYRDSALVSEWPTQYVITSNAYTTGSLDRIYA